MHAHLMFSIDSEVIGPLRTPENIRLVVRDMRKAKPSPGIEDLLVMARVFHTMFTERPDTVLLPVLARHEGDPSLLKAVLSCADYEDFEAFERAEAEDYLAGANIARWVMGLRQHPHPLLVLREPPPDPEVLIPRQCPGYRLDLAVG